MNETEDEFVRYTRQDLRLDKSTFDEKRCREIYRRTRREIAALDTSRLPPYVVRSWRTTALVSMMEYNAELPNTLSC